MNEIFDYYSLLKPKHRNLMTNFTTLLRKGVVIICVCIFATSAIAQTSFTATSAGLQPVSATSYADCAADMDQDGLDDIVRVTSAGIYIDYQNANGSFTPFFQSMSIVNLPSWSICAADIDGNGHTDLVLGAGNALSFVYASDDGSSFTEDAFPEYIFTQRTTFCDIDNDGNLDSFCCHDVDLSHPYRNVNGVLELDFSLINTLDAGGNYAAIWCDYDNDWDSDLYITKCRGGAPVGDPQRINLLYRNDGDGVFTSVGPEANMDDGDQSWATVFEDFDNDGDFDSFTVNHAWANRLMENNGDGTFTDIIEGSGINASDLGAWNCDAGDFDNNGFVDIFSEMSTEMYWNNGDGTFTGQSLAFNSGGIGDFNNDGFLDVVTGNTIYQNQTNANNWVKFNLEGLMSNKSAVGARVEIYGSWGIQIREVRAGESFDPASSLITHFGLGTADAITSVVVKWPSGMVTTIENPAINTTHDILEVGCLLDPISVIVDGNTEICEGQSVTLTAPAGASYSWNNGATTQTIEASNNANYSVIVFDEAGCAAISNDVSITVITEETPVISALGETFFCQGGSVVLSSTVGASYNWSNGQSAQSIEVTESGTYAVNIEGACTGTALSSNTIDVTVLAAPAPVASDVTIGEAGTATLTAIGNNLEWFATETSTEVLGTGASFETPFFDNTISYWVQGTTNHFGEQQTGGKLDVTGAGGLPSSGGRLFFNATEAFTLLQVTCIVPSVDGVAGNRTIQLFDAGGALLQELVVNLPVGNTVVDLNFYVPAGDGYQIGCAENNLYRNSGGVVYPYALGTVGEIYNSTFGAQYYYYFYDWKIQKEGMNCTSERVEVAASVVGINELSANPLGLSIYPNPAVDQLNFSAKANVTNAIVRVTDATGRIVTEQKMTATAGSTQTLNVSNLSAGVYHISMTYDGFRSDMEFVKH
jgi:hypothetical protein